MNLHLRNQLIIPNLWGKSVISYCHVNSYLFKHQYAKFHENMLILVVILTNIFDLSIQYKINTHIEILVKINPKKLIFFMKFCTLVYKHIFNHIAKRDYEFAPKDLGL